MADAPDLTPVPDASLMPEATTESLQPAVTEMAATEASMPVTSEVASTEPATTEPATTEAPTLPPTEAPTTAPPRTRAPATTQPAPQPAPSYATPPPYAVTRADIHGAFRAFAEELLEAFDTGRHLSSDFGVYLRKRFEAAGIIDPAE